VPSEARNFSLMCGDKLVIRELPDQVAWVQKTENSGQAGIWVEFRDSGLPPRSSKSFGIWRLVAPKERYLNAGLWVIEPNSDMRRRSDIARFHQHPWSQ
jgi:hypothetical protein